MSNSCRKYTLARASKQLPLLEVEPRFKLSNNANARNAYGQAAQEIVCKTLRLLPIPITGAAVVCFDAESVDGETFYEIKSCKRAGKVVCYDWRMRKESKHGARLRYAILLHRVKGERDGSKVISAMLQSNCEIITAPAQLVHQLAYLQPLHVITRSKIDPRNGYTRPGYRDGYRNLPVSELLNRCSDPSVSLAVDIYGHQVSIPVHNANIT